MAEATSTVNIKIKADAASALTKMANDFIKPQRELEKIQQLIKKIGDSETKLTDITQKELREQVAAYRKLKAEAEALEKVEARRAALIDRLGKRALATGGVGGGGGILASLAGGIRGFGIAGGLGQIASAAASGLASGNTGQAIGGSIGGALGTAANFIPAIGPLVAQIVTPALTQLGSAIGAKFGKDSPAETKELQKSMADSLKELVKKQDEQKRTQEDTVAELKKLVATGEISVQQAQQAAQVVGAQFGQDPSRWERITNDLDEYLRELGQRDKLLPQLIAVLEDAVRNGSLSRKEAVAFASSQGFSNIGKQSDILNTGDGVDWNAVQPDMRGSM